MGIPLSWSKGGYVCAPLPVSSHEVSLRHTWIGIAYATGTNFTIMGLPQEFVDGVVEVLNGFCRRQGHAPAAAARALLGKAGRVAQVVPAAAPFVSSLWAAYLGSLQALERGVAESPPGTVPVQRFFAAAGWFRALLTGEGPPDAKDVLFPLQRIVYSQPDLAHFGTSPFHVEFDASPWGGGAVLRKGSDPVSYFSTVWDDAVLELLEAEAGDSRFQSLWEFVTLLLALITWREYSRKQVLFLLGDNIGALQDAISLRGKGAMNVVAREISWRRAKWPMHFDCAHLPKEHNVDADALSRLAAVPPCAPPLFTLHVRRAELPPWDRVWRAWVPRA